MGKYFLAFFAVVVALAAVIEAGVLKPKTREGFRHLGSMKKSRMVTRMGLTSARSEDWDYWESVNAAGHSEARKDCEANGDTLLAIETREELDNVTRFLQDTDNTGSLYWTGGKYDLREAGFLWGNGVPLSPDAPWGEGQPREKKANTRVALDALGREVQLKTQPATTSTRYICEGERAEDGDQEQIPQPCYRDNDLVIVMDESGSIGSDHFIIAKEFTARLATTWVDHVGSRVAVQTFATDARKIFGVTDDQSVATMKDAIYKIVQTDGGTNSWLGIDLAAAELQGNERGVMKNLVFLTDGGSASREQTKQAADNAIALGIRTYSVGIGNVVLAELLDIAGGDQAKVFTTDQFEELLALLRPLSRKVCEV